MTYLKKKKKKSLPKGLKPAIYNTTAVVTS